MLHCSNPYINTALTPLPTPTPPLPPHLSIHILYFLTLVCVCVYLMSLQNSSYVPNETLTTALDPYIFRSRFSQTRTMRSIVP